MKYKKLEKEVKKNANVLHTLMPSLLGKHKGKYVTYNNGEKFFSDDFNTAIEDGIKKFGKDVGFVVDEVAITTPILSSLVKL